MIMKKIFLLLAFLSVMLLPSCNRSNNGLDDELDNPAVENPEDTVPDICQIIYKTVNDEVLQFGDIDTLAVFGTAIVSNEYENGRGIITFESDIDSVAGRAFRERAEVVSIELPVCVKEIGMYAFYGSNALVEVKMPNGVEKIGYCAFQNCSALTDVVIPNSVTNIGEYAFSGCSSIENVVIPEGVEVVGDLAFNECSALESVTIPASVKSVGNFAFYGCSALKEVHISDLAAWQAIEFGTYASPLENKDTKLYLNGEEVIE